MEYISHTLSFHLSVRKLGLVTPSMYYGLSYTIQCQGYTADNNTVYGKSGASII